MDDSLIHLGLVLVCETCEGEIDFPDEHTEHGVCRHCGIAFLRDVPVSRARAS